MLRKSVVPAVDRRTQGRLSNGVAENAAHAAPGICNVSLLRLEHLTLAMLAYGRQKPAYSRFVARIFRKILAEQLTHFMC
ncbi:MAG: hypothetical protein BCS36_09025 [Desulfovibrio sp. MES5]|nr:MAG: hypothetical protein BCS36_09025 [Desulfovibrio sp. MES5]